MIKLIVAIDKNNLIGNGDKMPWHIKDEFIHFKKTTLNHALLFGRTTFLGLPGKLEQRDNYVLSHEEIDQDCTVIHNEIELFELFEKFKNSEKFLFISGGKSIYEKYYQFANELIISRIKGEFNGDVYLKMDLSDYTLVKVDEFEKFNVEYYNKNNSK
ncbi:dihydrofolate reductase [Mycoplasmopsis alligatoris]|uniref:dihydrofolate reductase n=1 Tax=Mycoplasmopsis alligatoris A21JP2 TaxID=747682 RepID=D4XWL1_9BACT|nr:dihydrofolate reductase [Mycoplasmopsis alligatoris]EFF41164.1 dihydrofolate reductase [Mycoplasmopsis alligatoris A21JP2]